MKLNVQGIEEIEITDPAGLCNPPVPRVMPQPSPGQPMSPIIGPEGPSTWKRHPATGDVAVPQRLPVSTRHVHEPEPPTGTGPWGVGGPMIQRAAQQADPDKWEKNWQAKNTGEKGQGDGNQHTS